MDSRMTERRGETAGRIEVIRPLRVKAQEGAFLLGRWLLLKVCLAASCGCCRRLTIRDSAQIKGRAFGAADGTAEQGGEAGKRCLADDA